MGGHSGSREQNYEIKYLRKALLGVDRRIQVPESVSGQSLRHLLDGVEQPAPAESVRRARPRWLSLQSGVAYAAAFALIVALFYSTRLYRPDMIDGVMPVEQQAPKAAAAIAETAGSNNPDGVQPDVLTAFVLPEESGQDSNIQIADAQPSGNADAQEAPQPEPYAVGGSGMATLLLEREQVSYYWRLNDAADPDKAGFPCTLEVVDNATGQLAAQINPAEMQSIAHGFALEDRFVIVGSDGEDTVYIVYDTSNPKNPIEKYRHIQNGELADAKLYNGVLRIITLSDRPDGEVVSLPNSTGPEDYCVIGAVSLMEYRSETKSFAGADGTVQLHNLNAYIHYAGSSDNGEGKSYIAQINFDGLGIELGTVS